MSSSLRSSQTVSRQLLNPWTSGNPRFWKQGVFAGRGSQRVNKEVSRSLDVRLIIGVQQAVNCALLEDQSRGESEKRGEDASFAGHSTNIRIGIRHNFLRSR